MNEYENDFKYLILIKTYPIEIKTSNYEKIGFWYAKNKWHTN